MSLNKKTDVKNHLSPRHRTEIHLEPAIQADATGFPHDESAIEGPRKDDEPVNAAIVPAKSV